MRGRNEDGMRGVFRLCYSAFCFAAAPCFFLRLRMQTRQHEYNDAVSTTKAMMTPLRPSFL